MNPPPPVSTLLVVATHELVSRAAVRVLNEQESACHMGGGKTKHLSDGFGPSLILPYPLNLMTEAYSHNT